MRQTGKLFTVAHICTRKQELPTLLSQQARFLLDIIQINIMNNKILITKDKEMGL